MSAWPPRWSPGPGPRNYACAGAGREVAPGAVQGEADHFPRSSRAGGQGDCQLVLKADVPVDVVIQVGAVQLAPGNEVRDAVGLAVTGAGVVPDERVLPRELGKDLWTSGEHSVIRVGEEGGLTVAGVNGVIGRAFAGDQAAQ